MRINGSFIFSSIGKQLLVIFSFFFISISLHAQSNEKESLIKAIIEDCPTFFKGRSEKCTIEKKRLIEDKLNAAEIYLTVKLSSMVLSDSSHFYLRKKKELLNLEKEIPANKQDSLIKNNLLERSYLLVSLIKPSNADSLLSKLIYIYFDAEPISYDSHHLKSYFYYRVWLLKLLEERFKDETTSYSKYLALMYRGEVDLLLIQNFISIEHEKLLILQLEDFITKATNQNLNNYNREELLAYAYSLRSLKAHKVYEENKSDELFLHVEQLYLKSLNLNPDDYKTNYNLAILYYNDGAYFIGLIDSTYSDKELQIAEEKGSELFKKALPYMEKAKELNSGIISD
jgi:hypothetical protein